MSSPEIPESLSDFSPSIDSFEFTHGGETYSIPRAGSLIRRFQLGEGGFDYLIHASAEGRLVFMPGVEDGVRFFDSLERSGFVVESLTEPDDEAVMVMIELGLVGITQEAD